MIPPMPGIISLQAAMIGWQNSDRASLFYEFRLNDRILKYHPLRLINGFVMAALAGMRERLMLHFSEIE